MRSISATAIVCCCCVLCGTAWTFYEDASPARDLTTAAQAFVKKLDDAQKKIAILPYDHPKRVDWHFIPKPERKGLQVKLMSSEQSAAAFKLLHSALSQVGFNKTMAIISLESLLNELEGGRGTNIRDPKRYFVTLFGTPGEGRWGLSFEGHHLSLNFVIEGDRVVSSTPQVFAANPAIVKATNASAIPVGTRILAQEETLAFDLVKSFSDEQKSIGVFAKEPLKEVRNAGVPQPSTDAPVGIPFVKLDEKQQGLLKKLIQVYCDAMPAAIATERVTDIEKAGWDAVHFGWAGATEPGIGHYYRVQGPTFLIEFVNTQPDAAGNIANHIHSIWRDMRGDFALPIAGK